MAVVTNKNRKMFDQITECLLDYTLRGSLEWKDNSRHMFANDSEKYFDATLNDQKFTINIQIRDSKLTRTNLTIWDNSFSDDFLLGSSKKVTKIGEHLFDQIKNNLPDTEKTTLSKIMGNIGKDYIREKRLEKLLDDEPTSGGKDSFINRVRKRFSKK